MSEPYTGQYSVLNQYTPLTQKYGAEYGVDPTLLDALIWRESGGNPMATNGSAMGLAQFTPTAMAQYGVSNPYDPAQSIKGAAEYLSNYSSAGVTGALQAYNAGAPGKTTETIGGVPYEDAVISTAQSLEAQSGATAPAGSLSAGVASQVPGSSAGSLSAGVASQTPGSTGTSSGTGAYNGFDTLDDWMKYQESGAQYGANQAEPNLSQATTTATKPAADAVNAATSAVSDTLNGALAWVESLFSTYGPEIIGVGIAVVLLYWAIKGSVLEGA